MAAAVRDRPQGMAETERRVLSQGYPLRMQAVGVVEVGMFRHRPLGLVEQAAARQGPRMVMLLRQQQQQI